MTNVALYRIYDHAGDLLYVGISRNPPQRLTSHGQLQDWWPEVARIEIEWLNDREAAGAAEVVAIKEERPRYNIRHADRSLRVPAAVPSEWVPLVRCLVSQGARPPWRRTDDLVSARTLRNWLAQARKSGLYWPAHLYSAAQRESV